MSFSPKSRRASAASGGGASPPASDTKNKNDADSTEKKREPEHAFHHPNFSARKLAMQTVVDGSQDRLEQHCVWRLIQRKHGGRHRGFQKRRTAIKCVCPVAILEDETSDEENPEISMLNHVRKSLAPGGLQSLALFRASVAPGGKQVMSAEERKERDQAQTRLESITSVSKSAQQFFAFEISYGELFFLVDVLAKTLRVLYLDELCSKGRHGMCGGGGGAASDPVLRGDMLLAASPGEEEVAEKVQTARRPF